MYTSIEAYVLVPASVPCGAGGSESPFSLRSTRFGGTLHTSPISFLGGPSSDAAIADNLDYPTRSVAKTPRSVTDWVAGWSESTR